MNPTIPRRRVQELFRCAVRGTGATLSAGQEVRVKSIGWRRRVLVLVLGVMAFGRPAWASPDYTKKERKKCVYCHDGGWTSGKLTAAGTYFLAHNRSLKGFSPAPVPAHPQGSAGQPANVP
jgi:hypothetical protein